MTRPRTISDEAILTEARRAWLDDPTLPTSSIAKRLGVSEATLFKRFGTKANLLHRALAFTEKPAFFALLAQGPDDRPVKEQLHELVDLMDAHFVELVPRITAFHLASTSLSPNWDTDGPLVLQLFDLLFQWFDRLRQARRIKFVDPRLLVVSLMSLLQSRIFWRIALRTETPTPERLHTMITQLTDKAVLDELIDVFAAQIEVEQLP